MDIRVFRDRYRGRYKHANWFVVYHDGMMTTMRIIPRPLEKYYTQLCCESALFAGELNTRRLHVQQNYGKCSREQILEVLKAAFQDRYLDDALDQFLHAEVWVDTPPQSYGTIDALLNEQDGAEGGKEDAVNADE